jgi:hypothetical protein
VSLACSLTGATTVRTGSCSMFNSNSSPIITLVVYGFRQTCRCLLNRSPTIKATGSPKIYVAVVAVT